MILKLAEVERASHVAPLNKQNTLTSVTYREEFVSVCENLFNFGLKEYEKREAEVSEFYECRNEALTANQQESRKLILDFENRNKTVTSLYFCWFDTWFIYTSFSLRTRVALLKLELRFCIYTVVPGIGTWSLMAESQSGWGWWGPLEGAWS